MNRDRFVQDLMPHAMRVSQRTGLDPRLVIAQAAQETGWGRSAPNNNFFGIKSHGRRGGAALSTHEYVGGNRQDVTDSFRTYDDMGQSADDYAEFLMTNPRYREMLASGDLDSQVAALGRSGYATDPNYANAVGSIARSINLDGTATASSRGGDRPIGGTGQPESYDILARSDWQGQPRGQGIFPGDTGALDQSNAEPEPSMWDQWEPTSLAGKVGKWATNPERSDALLAIGSGLLSGKSWAEGGANAAENLLQVSQHDELMAQRQQQIDQNGSQEQQAYNRVNPVGNVEMPDGTIYGDVLQDNAGYFRMVDGQRVSVEGGQRINNSDSFGSKGQPTPQQAKEAQEDLITTGHSLAAMDKLIEIIPTIPTGVSGVVSDLQKVYRTMMERGLDPNQLNRADAQAELQSILGSMRLDIVGPGVMTEQDAMRIVTAMGGDMASILSNPEVAVDRITTLRERTHGRYEHAWNQYDTTIKAYPRLNYLPVEKYERKPSGREQGPPRGSFADPDGITTSPIDNTSRPLPPSIEDALKKYGI